MPRSQHLSLIVKGPVRNARRAAHRHGVVVKDCRSVSGDVQCYVKCSAAAQNATGRWYAERNRSKAGRGFPPGTLLYYSGSCAANLGRRRKAGK